MHRNQFCAERQIFDDMRFDSSLAIPFTWESYRGHEEVSQ